jgi:hypothetical protein
VDLISLALLILMAASVVFTVVVSVHGLRSWRAQRRLEASRAGQAPMTKPPGVVTRPTKTSKTIAQDAPQISVVCPNGHKRAGNPKFCDECGAAMHPPSALAPRVADASRLAPQISSRSSFWGSNLRRNRSFWVASAVAAVVAMGLLSSSMGAIGLLLGSLILIGFLGYMVVMAAREFRQLNAARRSGNPTATSPKGWLIALGCVALVGIGAGGFQLYKTQSYWYRSGYEAANAEATKKILYASGPLGPLQFCSAQQSMAISKGADETGRNWIFDGCIAGLKDLLGSREYERLIHSG